jgi:hypothetical protein
VKKLLVLIVVLFTSSAAAQVYLPDTSTNPLFGELVWHTLGYHSEDLALYPGELPPNMPFAWSQPEGSRLIGSQVNEYTSRSRSVQIVLETPLTTEKLADYYRKQFKAPWQERPRKPSGFSESADVTLSNTRVPLCNTATGVRVDFNSTPKDYRTYQTSNAFGYFYFFESSRPQSCDIQTWDFPILLMPSDSQVFYNDSYTSQEHGYQIVPMQVPNSSIAKLHKHFADQVPKTWEKVSATDGDKESYSVFRFTDKLGSGAAILSITAYPERPDTYTAKLVALINP